jgi:membrane protease YdiL (CAAX protease family)
MEELLFRGFVFRVLRDVTGMWIALAISAALFGFLHAANPGATAFSSVAIALEAGVLLAVAYAATNRLWLPIGIHAGWNYAEGTIFGTAVSGGVVKSTFLHATLTGNSLWTGGAFGVEASIVAIPVCLAAAALLALRVKRERLVEATA